MKRYTIVAGVHGVGKTSFCGVLNGVSTNFGPVLGDAEISNACMEKGVSFTQETTLSGYRTERTARKARELGYAVRLYYIGLDTAAESMARIQNRVRRGGHNIPENDVERRFAGRWEALEKVLPYCDTAEFYDNDNGFVKVAEYRNGELLLLGDHRPKWILELQEFLILPQPLP